jgi:hypothetical protein
MQGCVHWLQACRARKASHKPGMNTLRVIVVDARQVAYYITFQEFHHADHAFPALFTSTIYYCRNMLNQSNPFGHFDLFLFSQLCSRLAPLHSLLIRWKWPQPMCERQIPCAITATQHRHFTGCGTIKAVSHFLSSPQILNVQNSQTLITVFKLHEFSLYD